MDESGTGADSKILAAEEPVKPLSKKQQKKKLKLERKLQFRAQKRKLERVRKREKRKQAKLEGVELPPNRKTISKLKKDAVDVTIVIDCSFEEYMTEPDLKKLVKQIQRCYALNRRADQPFKLHVTSYGGKTKQIISNLVGSHNWNVTWSDESYDKIFTQEQLVYLTSDSSDDVHSVDLGKVYVIGGLVDHNSKKGLCHRLAEAKEIHNAKLPISRFVHMQDRKVLTVDHVFEILQKYYTLKDWKEAFFSVIPKRKGLSSLENTDGNMEDKEPQKEKIQQQKQTPETLH